MKTLPVKVHMPYRKSDPKMIMPGLAVDFVVVDNIVKAVVYVSAKLQVVELENIDVDLEAMK